MMRPSLGPLAALLAGVLFFAAPTFAATSTPNVVIIFTDDQGYVDVGSFGA